MRKYRVSRADLTHGAKIEQKEHPWASDRRARQISRDHLLKYGPGYYRAEPVSEKIVQNINTRMGAKPKRRRKLPPDGILYDPFMRQFGL